jgi:hypothetical protein
MILFLLGFINSINAQNKVFGLGSKFHCIVEDDEVKFYGIDENYNWNEITKARFTLPNGYKDVFGYGDNVPVLAVVVDNKVKFFYNDSILSYNIRGARVHNNWREITADEFTLPNGYKNVFWSYDSSLGVVVNNKVKYFTFSATSWFEETGNVEFDLPNGYKNIFIYCTQVSFMLYTHLCVVVDNKLKFFDLVQTNWYKQEWTERTDYEFTLPDGYTDVYRFGNHHFCILIDDKVKLFNYDGINWNERTEFEFNIR